MKHKQTWMKATLAAITVMALTGCSHNPGMMVIGKHLKIGTTEYGELSYLNGFSFLDCARENSGWRIEINDNAGLSFDKTTNTLKGVKSITRVIGGQATGYLVDLAEASPDAAMVYIVNNTPDKMLDILEKLTKEHAISSQKEENKAEDKKHPSNNNEQ